MLSARLHETLTVIRVIGVIGVIGVIRVIRVTLLSGLQGPPTALETSNNESPAESLGLIGLLGDKNNYSIHNI